MSVELQFQNKTKYTNVVDNLLFYRLATPKEMQNIKFVKQKHKRLSEEQDNDEIPPPTKIRVKSDPQDPPKLSMQTLYKCLHGLVPQACLFTTVEPPTDETVADKEHTPVDTNSMLSNHEN